MADGLEDQRAVAKPLRRVVGWQCPKCARVWAPWVDRCPECSPEEGDKRKLEPLRK